MRCSATTAASSRQRSRSMARWQWRGWRWPTAQPSTPHDRRARTPFAIFPIAHPMTYEEYLDEVTTLLTELYEMEDDEAIKHVMRAQAADFFTLHDDLPEMRTQQRAEQDAKTIFEQKNKSRPHAAPKRAGKPKK